MENKVTPKKIMISYGRADATEFVVDINKVLTDAGHTVWIDKSLEENNGIRSGMAWEESIEEAIKDNDIVIAVLTPHAIRRSNGVCLDEISMARFENKLIIPIMYKEVKPPLCIFRLDWIDFLKSDMESVIQQGNEKLLKSITENKLAYEGQNKQFSKLKSLNFDAKLVALKKDFVGREWIFDANKPNEGSLINDWLDGNSPIMMILGAPGIGKSAISAYLVEKHPSCIAYHFCIADDEETLNPNKFIRSIAHQMTSQLGDAYRDKVLEEIDELPESPVSLFRTLISNPLSQLKVPDNKTYFIVVDGLDEASKFNSDNELLKLFSSSFINALPPHVRFIFTSRDEKSITSRFDAYNPYRLEASAEQNISDLKKYIEMITNKYGIEILSSEDMASLIEKSEGSILYLQQIFEEVKNYDKKKIDITKLPKGLFGIYEEYFSKTFKNEKKYSKYRKTLEVLVALYTPISKELLAIILGKDEVKLKKIETYFPIDSNGNILAFHKSLLDWLIESPIYSVNEIDGHRRIIETTKLDFDDADELRIYIYSATKVFVNKQAKRDTDVMEVFENKIAVNLEKLGFTNEDHNLIATLKRLLILETKENKTYKEKLESLEVDVITLDQLRDRYENEDKEKWSNDYLSELHSVAISHKNNNKLQEATALEEKSLQVAKQLYKQNPSKWAKDYTTALNNLADSYSKNNRLNEAIVLGQESLQIAKELYMENPKNGAEDYTILLNNLANSYKNQNRFDEAIELQTKSLEILETLYRQNPDRWANDFVLALIKASYINQVYLDTALKVALGISNELYRSEALVLITPKMDNIVKALEVAMTIAHDKYKLEALSSIAAKIDDKESSNWILEIVRSLSEK